MSLIITTVNAPVLPIHATGVTGAEAKFLTPYTCSLKDDMVNRVVFGHGVTGVSGATNIFHPGPCSTVRMNQT